MASFVAAALALVALVPNTAFAQSAPDPNFTPLASKHFDYTALVRLLSSPSSPLFPYLLSPPALPSRHWYW